MRLRRCPVASSRIFNSARRDTSVLAATYDVLVMSRNVGDGSERHPNHAVKNQKTLRNRVSEMIAHGLAVLIPERGGTRDLIDTRIGGFGDRHEEESDPLGPAPGLHDRVQPVPVFPGAVVQEPGQPNGGAATLVYQQGPDEPAGPAPLRRERTRKFGPSLGESGPDDRRQVGASANRVE